LGSGSDIVTAFSDVAPAAAEFDTVIVKEAVPPSE
jgi:hypothetical protein